MKDEKEKLNIDNGVKSTVADKINRIMRDWMIDIVLALMIGTYILTTLITVELTSDDIFGILGDSALLLMFLIAIKSLMLRKGIFVGEKNEIYLSVKARYDDRLMKAMEKSQYLADYLSDFNEREQRESISRALAQYGMNYEQYINGIENPTKTQEMGIKAANRVKSLQVSVTDLTGSGVKDEKNPGLGKTKNEFLKSKSVTSASITLLSVVIFSVFSVRIASDFNWANLIWVGLQIVAFLIKGTTSFISAYVFITEEYTNRLIRQTNMLIDFDNTDIKDFEKKREEKRRKAEEEREKSEELKRLEEEKAKKERIKSTESECNKEEKKEKISHPAADIDSQHDWQEVMILLEEILGCNCNTVKLTEKTALNNDIDNEVKDITIKDDIGINSIEVNTIDIDNEQLKQENISNQEDIPNVQ